DQAVSRHPSLGERLVDIFHCGSNDLLIGWIIIIPKGRHIRLEHDINVTTRRADMNTSIFGAGNMASGLAGLFAAAGHSVTVASRDPAKARTVAAELGGGIEAGSFADAANSAEA